MKYTEAGEYTITYKAVDECGNEATKQRTVVVTEAETYRTVLYADGTFIINEKSSDIEANQQAHGTETNIYPPLDAEHDYVFADYEARYWHSERASIKSTEFGSPIQPTSTAYWFIDFTSMESIDTTNLDTSNVTDMQYMFDICQSLTSLDVTNFDTSNVTNMRYMFAGCGSLTSLDVTNFDTSNVTDMSRMFYACERLTSLDVTNFDTSNVTVMGNMFGFCGNLQTIYASELFDTSNVTEDAYMFDGCTSLVGGAGTTYNSSKTNAEYARIDNPPSEKGYFTQA